MGGRRWRLWRAVGPIIVTLSVVQCHDVAAAAELTLTWKDNSSGEQGFAVARKSGTQGTFSQIAVLGANTTSYTDSGLASGATYCYRVRAFDSTGTSAYSSEVCGTTLSAMLNITVTKAGTGS